MRNNYQNQFTAKSTGHQSSAVTPVTAAQRPNQGSPNSAPTRGPPDAPGAQKAEKLPREIISRTSSVCESIDVAAELYFQQPSVSACRQAHDQRRSISSSLTASWRSMTSREQRRAYVSRAQDAASSVSNERSVGILSQQRRHESLSCKSANDKSPYSLPASTSIQCSATLQPTPIFELIVPPLL